MEEITAYVQAQPVKRFSKDSILIYQGEVPPTLYAIRSGFVKIYDLSGDGNEQMIGLSGTFDFIPSELLFSRDIVSQFFYAAFTAVEVYVINRDELMSRIRGDAEVLYRIAHTLSEQYRGLRWHLTAVQKPRAREKIVYVLYFLALYFVAEAGVHNKLSRVISEAGSDMKGHDGSLQKVAIPLTQQDIANLVGITRETAAHELKKLKNEGYISYSKSAFYIRDTLQSLIA